MSEHSTTREESEALANEMRVLLQGRTCCASTAAGVALTAFAGFCLDYNNHNGHQAAAALMKASREMAARMRRGDFKLVRHQ